MQIPPTPLAGREQVLAFRLAGHNLASRLPADALLTAAGACGLQNTPPGSAALALHARLAGLTPQAVTSALESDKSLLQMWSLRGAPYVFPTREAAIFTLGLLPEDEMELYAFIPGIELPLKRIGMSAAELVALTSAALLHVLNGRQLPFRRLSTELAALIEPRLTPQQGVAWQSPSNYGPGQPLGEALVHFALRPIALQGLFCFVSRQNGEAAFARTGQWLGDPLPQVDPNQARIELVRHYLHCYGPSNVKHFAAWAGVAPSQAERAWRLLEPELCEVNFDGRPAWLLLADLARFQAPPPGKGVRFLPPYDPYLQLRDRATLIPDQALHRRLWLLSGNPGVILVDGQCVAIWRPQKKGQLLKIAVDPFNPFSQEIRLQAEAEAATLAPFRGCASVEVEW